MKVKLLFPFLMLLVVCINNKPMTYEQKAVVREEGSIVAN